MLTVVATIKAVNQQMKELERQIATAISEHPDGAIFTSLFKRSTITAAELLAEIGDCRGRYPSRDALAGDAGQSAVAIESGKRKAACFRWGCNKRLRAAFCTLADTTRHWHPWAQDLYAAARARGHDHPRALRTLGRARCRIVWQCWQDGVPYDPARHRALQHHITVTIPTPSAPMPDLAATQRMAGTAVTQTRPARAEREALNGKPSSANRAGRPAKHHRGLVAHPFDAADDVQQRRDGPQISRDRRLAREQPQRTVVYLHVAPVDPVVVGDDRGGQLNILEADRLERSVQL